MAALAVAGTLPSYNMDLAFEHATKISAFVAKVTADEDGCSTLHETQQERFLCDTSARLLMSL